MLFHFKKKEKERPLTILLEFEKHFIKIKRFQTNKLKACICSETNREVSWPLKQHLSKVYDYMFVNPSLEHNHGVYDFS